MPASGASQGRWLKSGTNAILGRALHVRVRPRAYRSLLIATLSSLFRMAKRVVPALVFRQHLPCLLLEPIRTFHSRGGCSNARDSLLDASAVDRRACVLERGSALILLTSQERASARSLALEPCLRTASRYGTSYVCTGQKSPPQCRSRLQQLLPEPCCYEGAHSHGLQH